MSSVTIDLKPTTCIRCGITFGMPSEFYNKRLDDHSSFTCPNGHSQYFSGKSDAEILQEKLDAEKRKLANAQFEIMAAKEATQAAEKKAQRLAKRIKNGACPCCHHQFTQLTRHMKTKHPEYQE